MRLENGKLVFKTNFGEVPVPMDTVENGVINPQESISTPKAVSTDLMGWEFDIEFLAGNSRRSRCAINLWEICRWIPPFSNHLNSTSTNQDSVRALACSINENIKLMFVARFAALASDFRRNRD